LQEAVTIASILSTPTPPGLFGTQQATTHLDALRVWLLQPAARPPEWQLLQDCQIERVEQPTNDRILSVALRSQTPTGETRQLQLQAELFTRGLNLILFDPDQGEIANWQGRAPATPHEGTQTGLAHAADRNDHSALQPWQQLADACAVDLVQESRRVFRRQRHRLQQLVRGLERDLEAARQAATWRKKGELLSANLHQVRKGQAQVELADWSADNAPVAIELDPSVSPQENVARFFKRAKRGERGRDTIVARLAAAQQELQQVPASADNDEIADFGNALIEASRAWKQALDKDPGAGKLATLWQAGGPPWQPDRASDSRSAAAAKKPNARQQSSDRAAGAAAHPGRRFVLAGKWEVLVGRSNAENDELTHRFAHPQDVWLHASGVPGSHVVLRMHGSTDNPPRDILEQAAAIAARFSKAKHAGTVPVIWTRKRHVRKPRGAKAGLAMCTQEKTVFVKPGIPEEDA
jgi:predicted ribosome quality control (RQC) complex YloA/Tae2 family protein